MLTYPLEESTTIPTIPFKHNLILFPPNATPQQVFDQYKKALIKTKETLGESGSGSHAYNVSFVKEWIVVIPRREKGREGVGANSAGMMGMVWLRDAEERRGWDEEGLARYLVRLGVLN